MRKLVTRAQKSVLGGIAVLTIIWSSGAAFVAPRVAQAAPGSWPASWNVATVAGVPVTDFEERSGCTDPTNGGSAVSPDESDIGSEADCQGGTRVNPGSAPSQYYFYDEGAIPTVNCATTADDYFYMRTRYAGDPVENTGDLKGSIWNQILDTTGDGVADFIVTVDGATQAMTLRDGSNAVLTTVSTDVLAQGYARVVATPEQPPVDDEDHEEFFMDLQIPISAFPAGSICAGTEIRFTQVSTSQDPNNPTAKDTLFTVPGDPIPVGSGVDLAVTKIVDDAAPVEGTQVIYTVTVVNNGPDDATGVALNDLLPAGVTYVSDDSATTSTSYDETTGIWTIGNLADGASITLNITATVDQDTAGDTITNTACTDHEDDEESSNDCDSVDIIPVDDIIITDPEADLEVSKVASDTTPVVGTNFNYTISVTNAGPDDATNASVDDLLPVGVTYVSDNSADTGTDYDETTGVWTIGSLANGATIELVITVSVDAGTAGEVISNTACAESDLADPDQTDDCDTADVTPDPTVVIDPQADELDIAVTESVSDATPNEGDTIAFTITALNVGPTAGTGVQLSVTLPAGVTFVSSAGVGSYDPATNVWTIGNLGVGNSAVLTISVTVDAGTAGQTMRSEASLLAVDQTDTDPTNNEDDAEIVVPTVTTTQTPVTPTAPATLVETGFGSNVQIIAGLALLAALGLVTAGSRRRSTAKSAA